MYAKTALLFAATALGHVIRSEGGFHCSAPEATEEQKDMMRVFAQKEAANRAAGIVNAKAAVNVDVYMHAVSASEGGLASDEVLQGQFDTLNEHFGRVGFSLNYAGHTRTVNADWANDGNGQEMAMKQELRQGDMKAMNFYIIDVLPTASGYCYYPADAPEGSEARTRDGCTLAIDAVGLIAVHEGGHWFGLLHTFDGDNCDGPGDLVDDTPAQSGPSSGCPASRDSCPNQPGEDPIHNYMDYTSPDCWTGFSQGQIDRMNSQWEQFRA
ncbi:hypothetical protein N3K66_007819 [Trichothecium roseum]|uniref:Uncharacterized protein n=1 Tax=Trichothecium roseum TaxID=47278 RepID=A0ACC0US80_9HYPO|nr:hypothetical protein N3K66_007819 [Trichothecium roseum]